MRAVPDPYRVLGVGREATSGEIRAAHRRLAKRYHPDAAEGDTDRFLAVQEAYQVLSDPLTRRDWDARHRPGPVRADGATAARARPARSGAGRGAPRDRRAGGQAAGADATSPEPDAETAGPDPAPGTGSRDGRGHDGAGPRTRGGSTHRQRRRPEAFSASGRDPTADAYTWSAEDVPWWTSRGAARDRPADASATDAGTPPPDARPGPAPTADFDVYDRSSGAAWSMASRAYFRRAGADLPRGAAEPFGQRWTTPPGRPSTGPGRSPTAPPPARPIAPAPSPARAAAPPRPAFATPAAPGVVFGSEAAAGIRGRVDGGAWPTVGGRVLYTSVGWLALAVGLGVGPLGLPAPVLAGLLAGLLVVLALAPRLAYLAAVGGVAALVIGAGVLLAGVVAGPHVPAAYATAGPLVAAVAYLVAAGLAALGWPVPRPWR